MCERDMFGRGLVVVGLVFIFFVLVSTYLSVEMSVREEGKMGKKGSILIREFGQSFNRGTPKRPFHLLQMLL